MSSTVKQRIIRRAACECLVLFAVALPSLVNATLAPVAGAHYPTGGASNASGGYSTSVPLDFSPTDPTLPIPLQMVHGGMRVGAAGLGWDIPISYVYHDTTIAHRRPENNNGVVQGHERWTLMLLGETIKLVPRNGSATIPPSIWVAQRGNAQIEVRANSADAMVLYDGNGLTYSFSAQGGSAGSRLGGGNLFLLRDITGPGGARVHLEYSLKEPALPNGGSGLSINLANVSYNKHPTASCFKNRINLNYDDPWADNPMPAPLAMSMLGSTVLVRMQKLISVDVTSRATCADANISLRRYNFSYQSDPDTRQPQLQKVTVNGQQSTPERNVTLPVAEYRYGSAVDPATKQITYQKSQAVAPPFHAGASTFLYGVGYSLASSSSEPHSPDDVVTDLITFQNLVDLNGDDRPDFFDETGFYQNTYEEGGDNVRFSAGTLSGSNVDNRSLVHSTIPGGAGRFYYRAFGKSINDTLRMEIDMNGDGRLDMVETVLPDIDHWLIHLNTPDPTDPKKIVWVDVAVPVTNLRAALNTTGLAFGRVPMARNSSVPNLFAHCWFWEGSNGRWQEDSISGCSDIPANHSLAKTLTEFELKDVNDDGYPDFVFNASYLNLNDPQVKPPIPSNPVNLQHASTLVSPDMVGLRDVKVLINTAGARLANDVDLFAATPVMLEVGGQTGCGIARWEPDPGITSTDTAVKINQTCGIEDVNGDGIVDRITSTVQSGKVATTAALGTGDLNNPYSAATIALPGPLGRTESTLFNIQGSWQTLCQRSTTAQYYDIPRTGGLHDINGDGIPDYVTPLTVAMGTGTGFAAPVSVVSDVSLELSAERYFCPNQSSPVPVGLSATPSGLYDLDGDGQPEFLKLIGLDQTSSPHWEVYQLKPPVQPFEIGHSSPSIPSAGRLIGIDNGYGAITRIDYRSAKEDAWTNHAVPYPEIVAAAIATTDSSGSPLVAPTRYAYGNVVQYFDASADAFVSTGFQRSIQLTGTVDGQPNAGVATITDTYGPKPFTNSPNDTFSNNLIVGLVSDVTTLSDSNLGMDPMTLLGTNITADTRRIAGAHYAWATRVLPAAIKPEGNAICINANPYTYTPVDLSTLTSADDMCVKNGFVFQTSRVAWRGVPGSDPQPALSKNVIATDTEVKPTDVDDLGRVTVVSRYNDLNRSDDDQCILTTYANPPTASARPRVLNAPAQRTVTNCAGTPITLSKHTWEYDTINGTKLSAGQVTNGFVTAHIVSRLDENGKPIPDAKGNGDIRLFDATYDGRGNPVTITKTRDDDATRTVTLAYDPFDLALTAMVTDASGGIPRMTVNIERDPVTLNPLNTGDPNGTRRGNVFDGFNRVLLSIVTPPGGSTGVLAAVSYAGFGVGETGGRRIVQKVFTDPVRPGNVATAASRTSTVFLDTLGREVRTEVNLGSDYNNQTLIVDQRTYDLQARVKFVADPFPSSQSFATAYGTTQYFNADGTPSCFIRGRGQRAFTRMTDEVNEVYPTCFKRTYEFNNSTEVNSVQGPDSLLPGSSQAGVKQLTAVTALGRPLVQSIVQTDSNGGVTNVLERMHFAHDPKGRITILRRFQNPNAVTNPVDTIWHYDSLGQVTELDEPAPNAPQFRSYDTWGELTASGWCDPAFGTCPTPATPSSSNRSVTVRYDALGRLTHREDRTNGAAIPQTVNDYVYDIGVNTTTPPVTATNVLGRLTKATSSTSSTSFSYDPQGRISAQVFTDLTTTTANIYVEKDAYHGDGSASALDLLLPDTNYADEHVDYTYDSAGRARSAVYSAGTTSQALFTTSSSTDIDVFGRGRHALYGLSAFDAVYADTGRRLIIDMKVTSPAPLSTSRKISFAPVAGTEGSITAFDPVGRERVRQEFVNGTANPVKVTGYDTLGRLSTTSEFSNTVLTTNRAFTYDALGNLLTQTDPSVMGSPGAVTLTYESNDRDRICSMAYGTAVPSTTCNVTYDAVGNIVRQNQPRLGSRVRQFSYFPSGHVRQIANATSDLGTDVATFDYDALGAVQRLVVTSDQSSDTRHDKHFGGLITRRDEGGVSTVTRTIPTPGGVATRHGANGTWTFTFGEARGTRFVTDQNGQFVQTMDYQPYGEAAARTGALPGTTNYTNEQWNNGDLLTIFGLNQLGARIYDPIVGRFVSRDPRFDGGNGFNPYAFAANDPVNGSDPSGLFVDSRLRRSGYSCEKDCEGGGVPQGGEIVPHPSGGGGTGPSIYGPIIEDPPGVIIKPPPEEIVGPDFSPSPGQLASPGQGADGGHGGAHGSRPGPGSQVTNPSVGSGINSRSSDRSRGHSNICSLSWIRCSVEKDLDPEVELDHLRMEINRRERRAWYAHDFEPDERLHSLIVREQELLTKQREMEADSLGRFQRLLQQSSDIPVIDFDDWEIIEDGSIRFNPGNANPYGLLYRLSEVRPSVWKVPKFRRPSRVDHGTRNREYSRPLYEPVIIKHPTKLGDIPFTDSYR